MKYIKKFESFNVNETMDMMFMPVDPIAGAADLYSDIYDEAKSYLKDKFNQFEEKLEQAVDSILPKIDGEKVMESVEKFFGKDPLKLTSEDIKLAFRKLEKSNESFIDKYDATDPYNGHGEGMDTPLKNVKGGAINKIGNILQNICGINLISIGTMGTFLAWLIGIQLSFGMSFMYSIIAFIIIHIVRKLATMAGY